jgi:3-methyladenine DNA glycosylase AlkD
MTADEVLAQLKPLGSEGYRKIMFNHGVEEPLFGVKIEELKKIAKRAKHDQQLALDLYETGIYDAQYLAGLIVDDSKLSKAQLRRWLTKGNSPPICEFVVAGVAADSPHGWELGREWIESKKETAAMTGWSTLSGYVSVTDDDQLDLDELKQLLRRVEKTIHIERNRVRYAMSGFVIAVGSYVKALSSEAMRIAKAVGHVTVDMGNTSCQVPYAPDYIEKVKQRGKLGKKRASARC